MKKIKRLLLRPFYCLYVWSFKIGIHPESNVKVHTWRGLKSVPMRNFNSWLRKHGYWRLTNELDNLKMIIPKSYIEFVKNNPNSTLMNPTGK